MRFKSKYARFENWEGETFGEQRQLRIEGSMPADGTVATVECPIRSHSFVALGRALLSIIV